MSRYTPVQMETLNIGRGEAANVISLPKHAYSALEPDFKHAVHLSPIQQLDLASAYGVIVKSKHRSDGLIAASYLLRKYEEQVRPEWEFGKEDDDELDDEFPSGDEPFSPSDPEADTVEWLNGDGSLAYLPVVTTLELAQAFTDTLPISGFIAAQQVAIGERPNSRKPYWYTAKYPLVITGVLGVNPNDLTKLRQLDRFVIYIAEQSTFMPFTGSEPISDAVNSFERKLLFDLEYELCGVDEPSNEFYQMVLAESARLKGYRLAKAIDRRSLIQELINYRGHSFESTLDIEGLVAKTIRKKRGPSKTLKLEDFSRVFVGRPAPVAATAKGVDDNDSLDALIGLDQVKEQLRRVVRRMKLNKERQAKGLRTSEAHLAAVFLGNPGTAKTTVARLFGRILCIEGVLKNEQFIEIARKDLIGKYVGWTAPTVATVFEQAKGGTIFIDEAYSLMRTDGADYADEALAEIIRQMENNPDTLVIFAGYRDEMISFVQEANPGLRSRLTNIIDF
ncbi:MAG: AAA family ATPase, partial [Bacillota bacterium]